MSKRDQDKERTCIVTRQAAPVDALIRFVGAPDDLGTPAAVAAIHNLVREGYKLFAVGASENARAAYPPPKK